MLKIAHRGASAYEPENTLRAFRRAIELGADMIELDVHLSRDGYPVIMHDATVDRTTNGTGYVRDKTLAELKELDAGKGERIPTLQEAMELVRGKCGLYIELKEREAAGPVVDAIHAEEFRDVIVASSDPYAVREVKRLDPEVPTSLLVGETEADFVGLASAVDADYIHLCWENKSPTPHKLLTPELLSSLHEHGLGVITWHEERPSEIRELIKLGVDGICSDKPDLIRHWIV